MGLHVLGISAAAQDPHDPVPHLPPIHLGPQGVHDAGELETENLLRPALGDRIVSHPLQKVCAIDAGRSDPHPDLPGLRDRHRRRLEREYLRPPRSVHDHRLHAACCFHARYHRLMQTLRQAA